jgi:hypothetical protein
MADLVGDATHEELGEAAVPACSHDDEIGMLIESREQDHLRRGSITN